MKVITVKKLNKEYRVRKRNPGVGNAFKSLFSREYSNIQALKNINFTVKEGERLAIIGPNGAGKSTLIKILTGVLYKTSGDVEVLGLEPFSKRTKLTKNIGVVFGQRTQLWWDLPLRDSLYLLRDIYKIENKIFEERLEKIKNVLELETFWDQPVRKLSLGQRMRAEIVSSIMHNPKILFLDEPTIGIDVVGKARLRDFIKKINQEFGTTLILTSHDMKDIEKICQRVMVIDKGKTIFDGSLDKLKKEHVKIKELKAVYKEKITQKKYEQTSDYTIITKTSSKNITKTIQELIRIGDLVDLEIREPDIVDVVEEVFNNGK